MRNIALLALLMVCTKVHAQTAYHEHDKLWFGADFALGGGRYTRELPESAARDQRYFGGSLSASALYAGRHGLGFGAHVAPGIYAVELPDVNGRVMLVDVGVDPFARLSWTRGDLTFRVPFGLSTGRLSWLRDRSGSLVDAAGGNDVGIGYHAALLVGGIVWLTDDVGLRVETGPWLRRMRFDEGRGSTWAAEQLGPPQGELKHVSWLWTLSLGFVRRYPGRRLPDDHGPPLPTPDYSTFLM